MQFMTQNQHVVRVSQDSIYPLKQGTSERVIWIMLTTPAAMVKHIPMMAIANDQFRPSSTLTPKMTMPMNMHTAEMQIFC